MGSTFLLLLGADHDYPYLLHLNDEKSLGKLQNEDYSDEMWLKESEYLALLNRCKIKLSKKVREKLISELFPDQDCECEEEEQNPFSIIDSETGACDAVAFVQLAVNVAQRRIFSPLMFHHLLRINDSLEITIRYFNAVSNFVQKIRFTECTKCNECNVMPFQVTCFPVLSLAQIIVFGCC